MASSRILDEALPPLQSASTLIEGTFVDIGARLGSATEILDRLQATFGQLQQELESEDLLSAVETMGQVTERIASLANSSDGADLTLKKIAQLTTEIGNRILQMRKAIKAVDVLAVNAKIAAAHISSAGEEFVSFADEIGRALKIAQVNLESFGSELSSVGETVRQAATGQGALQQRQIDAANSVPRELSRSVDTITTRQRDAASTALLIQQKAAEVGRQIGLAVMALQIGDSTRQRIEHVQYAISVLRNVGEAEAQRQELVGIGCRLQAAQLSDTADDLERQVRQILAALIELAKDAREIAGLGRHAFGTDTGTEGTFLSDLEDNVAHANDLLEALKTAQGEADAVVQTVLNAAKSLVTHMSAVQSLESDIRLMGLNTTLKCGRLGTEGRALTVIAQELRSCSNVTAEEAAVVMENLQAVTVTATQLSGRQRQEQAAEISEISAIMAESVAKLAGVGHSLGGALAALSRESETVIGLLDETVSRIDVHRQIGDALREAAEEMANVSVAVTEPDDGLVARRDELLASIAQVYTMAREREIHAGILHGTAAGFDMPPALLESGQGTQANLDDFLF
ncbi:MAG: chemotaxis protein [Dongiaceae bacterium]